MHILGINQRQSFYDVNDTNMTITIFTLTTKTQDYQKLYSESTPTIILRPNMKRKWNIRIKNKGS